jgi:hypothetical protein
MASIRGIEDFNKAVAELKNDVAKRVVRSALRAAAKPLITAAKANAKVLQKPSKYRTPGLMRARTIASNSRIASRKKLIGLYIKPIARRGAAKGAKSPHDPYYYRFIAAGFHAVGTRRVKGGRLTRAMNLKAQRESGKAKWIPGDDFIGKAFSSQGGAALKEFERTMKKRIDAANRRK